MPVSTPFPAGTKFASTLNLNNENEQHIRAPSLLNTREWGTFWSLRGRRFLTTTGYVPMTINSVQPVALLENPVGSGVVFLFDLVEFGSFGINTRFSRFPVPSSGIATRGTARNIGSTGGFTQVATVTNPLTETLTSQFKLYIGGTSPQFTLNGGQPVEANLRKVAPMMNSAPYFVEAHGGSHLRPGNALYWRADEPAGGGGGSYEAYINFEYVEVTQAEYDMALTTVQAAIL